MKLIPISPTFIDVAWKEGASCLIESTKVSEDEVTVEQLKYILFKGERTLLKLVDDTGTIRGWVVVKIQQFPNKRSLFITDLVCKNSNFERWMPLLKDIAVREGCSSIRCVAKPGQARLYKHRLGFRSLYETLEVSI